MDGSGLVKLTDIGDNSSSLAIYESSLLWLQGSLIITSELDGSGAVVLVDLDTPVSCGSGNCAPTGLTTDGTSLFWTDVNEDAIFKAPFDGSGGPEMLIDLHSFGAGNLPGTYIAAGITTDGTSLFWTDVGQDAIFKSAVDGSGAVNLIDLDTVFGPATYTPIGITTDGTSLFWADSAPGAVYSAGLDGSSAVKLFDDPSPSPDAGWIVVVPEPLLDQDTTLGFAGATTHRPMVSDGVVDQLMQTFTVGLNGTITSVELEVRGFSGPMGSAGTYGARLFDLSSWPPGTALPAPLEMLTGINVDVGGGDGWVSFPFAGGTSISVGDVLGFQIFQIASPSLHRWHGGVQVPGTLFDDAPYADGQGYSLSSVTSTFQPTQWDLHLRSYIKPNAAPTAIAGHDQTVRVGDTALLDGGHSSDDITPSESLEYTWEFIQLPQGSVALLTGADTATPSFVPDVPGAYSLQLVVTDEHNLSSPPNAVIINSNALVQSQLVYTDDFNLTIDTGSSDGTGLSTLVGRFDIEFGPGIYTPQGISTDGTSLFWTENISILAEKAIYRSSLDGTGVTKLIDLAAVFGAASYNIAGITTDGTSLFWTDVAQDGIYRSTLDGSGAVKLIDLDTVFGSGTYTPIGITTDGTSLFWADSAPGAVYSAGLDGSSAVKLFDDPSPSPDAGWIVVVPKSGEIPIYNQFGTFDNATNIADLAILDDFELAQDAELTGFRVWLSDHHGGGTIDGVLGGFDGELGWAIYADSGGAPDTTTGPLFIGADASPVLTSTGQSVLGNAEVFDVGATFPGAVALSGNTRYWFGVRDGAWGSNSDGTPVDWVLSAVGNSTLNDRMFDTNEANPTAFVADPGRDMVFQINGIHATGIPPTADAGDDQAIRAGDTVFLDGSQSFDDDTPSESLEYSWEFILLPAGSVAILIGADSPIPSFTADVAGSYALQLVVTDEGGLSSQPDSVIVSSDNLAPTGDAGSDQIAIVGETVVFTGVGTDLENDPIAFQWTITSAPNGSTVDLVDSNTAQPTLTPDVVGQYEVELLVSDFLGPGDADSIVITVVTASEFAEQEIVESSNVVVNLDPSEVTTAGNQNALTNFLSQALLAIEADDIDKAIDKLQKAIARTDGCALRGSPDGNGPGRDWITDCDGQLQAYASLTEALNALDQ